MSERRRERKSKRPPRKPGRRSTPPAAASNANVTQAGAVPQRLADKRRSALIGAVFHTHKQAEHEHAPYFLKPMELDDVIEHLATEDDLAIRNLGTAFLLDYAPDPNDATPPMQLKNGLDKLLGAGAPSYYQHLAQLPPSISWPDKLAPAPAGPAHDSTCSMVPHEKLEHTRKSAIAGDLPVTRFAEAYRMLAAESGGCALSNPSLRISQDPVTLVTSVEAQIDVARPPSDFTVLADPQNWQRQAYLFFLLSERGSFADGDFVPLPNPQPPGTIPYDGPLHELVTMSWNPMFPVDGNNVLNVHYSDNQPGMGVALSVSLSTTIGGSSEQGGLDVDGGAFVAQAWNGGTRLTGSKQVRFTERELCGLKLGRWLNLFAPFWLGPWMAMLVFEGACAPKPTA